MEEKTIVLFAIGALIIAWGCGIQSLADRIEKLELQIKERK